MTPQPCQQLPAKPRVSPCVDGAAFWWIVSITQVTSIYPIICLKYVDVRRLQVVILALSPREMSQTDRILPRYILSRVRVSVRPRLFYARKNRKPQSPAYFEPRQLGGVAVTRRAVNYDVTRCECREPGSNSMQGTICFHFYC